jgi:hypothetical protein
MQHLSEQACRAVLASHINELDQIVGRVRDLAAIGPLLSDAPPEQASHLAITLLETIGDLAYTLSAQSDALGQWLRE